MPNAQIPQTCRPVRIGESTKAELMERLASAHIQINSAGLQLFADERFRTLHVPTVIESVQVSVGSLGLPNGGAFAQVIEAAVVRGLAVCPLELAAYLRLMLLDQDESALGFAQTKHRAPPGSITVVSAPLDEDERTPKGFYLRKVEGTLWLRGYKSWPGHVWESEDMLIFARARNAA